jgi:hypothetical protein
MHYAQTQTMPNNASNNANSEAGPAGPVGPVVGPNTNKAPFSAGWFIATTFLILTDKPTYRRNYASQSFGRRLGHQMLFMPAIVGFSATSEMTGPAWYVGAGISTILMSLAHNLYLVDNLTSYMVGRVAGRCAVDGSARFAALVVGAHLADFSLQQAGFKDYA